MKLRASGPISILGSAPRKLREDAGRASVSPDGSQIAYIRGRAESEIWLMDGNGENPRSCARACTESVFYKYSGHPPESGSAHSSRDQKAITQAQSSKRYLEQEELKLRFFRRRACAASVGPQTGESFIQWKSRRRTTGTRTCGNSEWIRQLQKRLGILGGSQTGPGCRCRT